MPYNIYEYDVTRGRVAEVFEGPFKVSSAEDAYTFSCAQGIDKHEQEHVYALILNSKNNIQGLTLVSKGLVDRSHVHARELFRSAIIKGAARIIMVHNHPSGDPTPSSQDISTTREMVAAGNVVGIQVMDHVIIGSNEYDPLTKPWYSLKDNGFIH